MHIDKWFLTLYFTHPSDVGCSEPHSLLARIHGGDEGSKSLDRR
jgi:hypothetical protein